MATCINGHSSPDGAKFCGTCGGAIATGVSGSNSPGGVMPPPGGFRSTMKLSGGGNLGAAPTGGYVPPAGGGYIPPSAGGYVPPTGGYFPPAGGYSPPSTTGAGGSKKGMAIASMVLGICGLVFAFCFYPVGFVCSIVGVSLGGVALAKMKPGTDRSGRGMAIAGLICSIVTLALSVLFLIYWGSVFTALSNSSY